MSGRVFLDTNVLVNADDADTGAKQARAQEVVRDALTSGRGVISTQVLCEFFVIATRKLGVPAEVARRKVELLAHLDVVCPDVLDVVAAIDLCRLHRLALWDALVIRAAQTGGCQTLLTEDLSHGSRYDGVLVENPFLDL